MKETLRSKGWEMLPSRQDFCKGQYMISLFKNSWHLVYSPEQKIIRENEGELSYYELQQLELEIFGQ